MKAEDLSRHGIRVESGCLEWSGGRDPDGYGIVRINGVQHRVHRLAWTLANGPITDGMVIRHRCDNPPCFDSAHLVPGTHGDNVADMYRRGRQSDRRGELCPTAKLTWPQVREIRHLASAGVGQGALSAQFGICRRNVRKILNHESWKETA